MEFGDQMPNVNNSIDAHNVGPYHFFSIEGCNKFVNEGAGSIAFDVSQSGPNSGRGFGFGLPWLNRPLQRNKYCELLNDDFSVLEIAMI